KKLAHDNRNKRKNTNSSAGFHQNQLESICVFYLLASFCSASFYFRLDSLHPAWEPFFCTKKNTQQVLGENWGLYKVSTR
ncbi:hypothetical protein, partial [Streptococcus suis]